MKPRIDGTAFGLIIIDGETYEHDVIVQTDGSVKRRVKKLSKTVYGTSHVVSLEEIRNLYEEQVKFLVVGSGHHGILRVSDEARAYLEEKGCRIQVCPTPQAAQIWNNSDSEKTIGLFHITC